MIQIWLLVPHEQCPDVQLEYYTRMVQLHLLIL